MTSAKFSGFLTPTLPLSKFVQFSDTLHVLWMSFLDYTPLHGTFMKIADDRQTKYSVESGAWLYKKGKNMNFATLS